MADAIRATGLIRIHPSPGGPVAALRGLDLRVETGEVAAVIGPSGSGKSTLLRLVAGLDRPSAGCLVSSAATSPMPPTVSWTPIVGNASGSSSSTTGARCRPYCGCDAIALPLALRGVAPNDRRGRVEELLERVGLPDRGDAYPHQLSGGEQQRVAFAAAIATRPALLLADEPTGELDSRDRRSGLDVLRGSSGRRVPRAWS